MRYGVDEALAPALDDPLVDEASLGQREVVRPAVGDHGRADLDNVRDEPDERVRRVVGHESRPQASGEAITDFERQHDERRVPPVARPSSRARLDPADPGFIDLDPAMQLRPVGIHRRAPQLVEDHPGRLVAGDAELALEGEG